MVGKVPTFEVTGKPWFGPRKRARSFLDSNRRQVTPPGAGVFEGLKDVLGEHYEAITHVRFIDFRFNGDFRFTIALCWTTSSPEARQALFERAAETVIATGWYPLPQGERLHSQDASRALAPDAELPDIGNVSLESVSPAASGSAVGTAIRVTMSSGDSILLDSGFGHIPIRSASDRLVLVSHHHRDHFGGMEQGDLSGMPAAIPAGTAMALRAQGRLTRVQNRHPCTWVEPGGRYQLGPKLRLDVLAVPHMPGSVGFVLDDGANALLYSGDIAVTSARHDVVRELLSAIPRGRRATALLDATMAGRSEGVSPSKPGSQVAELLLETDVVVLAEYDHLLYAYLDVFHSVKESLARNQVSFLVTRRLKPLFEVLHDAFIRRRLEALDPFLAGQYGASMSSWGESRWLYWYGTVVPKVRGQRVWFVTPEDWPRLDLSVDAIVLPIGRVRAPNGARTTDAVDTTPWTGHSDAPSLAQVVSAFEADGHDVVLFHNFSRRIKKFARVHGLAARPLSEVLSISDVSA